MNNKAKNLFGINVKTIHWLLQARLTMGRIRQMIKVNGRECWTLFDTGALAMQQWGIRLTPEQEKLDM